MHNSFNYSTFTDLLLRHRDDLKLDGKETSTLSDTRQKSVTKNAYSKVSSSQGREGPWRSE